MLFGHARRTTFALQLQAKLYFWLSDGGRLIGHRRDLRKETTMSEFELRWHYQMTGAERLLQTRLWYCLTPDQQWDFLAYPQSRPRLFKCLSRLSPGEQREFRRQAKALLATVPSI
jgi:hypothetical protein